MSENNLAYTILLMEISSQGRHFVGIMLEFKKFKTTKFSKQYNRIGVFNKEKMAIIISCSLQFVLRPEDLKPLHDTFDVRYEPIIANTAGAAIKGSLIEKKTLECLLRKIRSSNSEKQLAKADFHIM